MDDYIEKAVLKRKGVEGNRWKRPSFDAISSNSNLSNDTSGNEEGGRISDQNQVYETNGIRLIPAEIVFRNALSGQFYTTVVMMSNISTEVIHLSISQPYSSAFQIKDEGLSIKLAPGLSISRKIIFTCGEAKLFFSAVPIRIGSKLVLLPIKVFPGHTCVIIEPSIVLFGKIDLGSAFMTRTVKLQNKGSIAAKFIIDHSKNELDIIIVPRTGSIKPFGTVEVKINLAGLNVGEHEVEFWVKTTPPSRFVVHVIVVVPFLKAIHPFATDEFTLLDMKPCFLGSRRYETFLVRNSSSNNSSIIVLAEFDGLVSTPQIAAQTEPAFRCLNLQPLDGIMGPFECRVFTLWFAPLANKLDNGWKHIMANDENVVQYLCFFRVQRVTLTNPADNGRSESQQIVSKKCELKHDDPERELEVIEHGQSIGGCSSSPSTLDGDETGNIIRVCAYAIAIKPNLIIVPDHLIFDKAEIGQNLKKVLRIYNPCQLPIGFSYVKMVHISVEPGKVVFIQSKKSIEIQVILHPKSLHFGQDRLFFEMLSYQNMTNETNLISIGKISIKLSINIKAHSKSLCPQFLPGITPRLHLEGEEVGLHTETILFSAKSFTDLPAAVMWPQWSGGRRWFNSNARIAFPNDRRRSLRVTEHDEHVRTIFTGELRYNVPLDRTNAYTTEERNNQDKIVAHYRSFVSAEAMRKNRLSKALDPEEPRPTEYEVDNERLYALLDMMPPVAPLEYKHLREKIVNHDTLCPLTPLDLFNIKVHPHVIDYGKVPPKTHCVTTVAVDNMNNFPIEVRFKSYKESLKVPSEALIVPAQSSAMKEISICVDQSGKHFTNMTYTINTYHSYDIKVCAEVETRYLIIEPGELAFRDGNSLFVKNFLPVKLINPLGSGSNFNWKVPSGSPFGVSPKSGTVPARSSLICSVYFDLKSGNILGAVLILQVEDGLNVPYPVNFIPSDVFTLNLFTPKISCPNTPLGIEYVKKIILFNYGRRLTFFSIDVSDLPKGIKILPFAGMIKPRSCIVLSVHLLLTEIRTFSFKVPILSTNFKRILLTCNGYTTYPKISFNPHAFRFRKTPVHSQACAKFNIVNESHSDVQISFCMANFPQFYVSRSSDIDEGSVITDGCFVALDAKETKQMYLHFEPHDLDAYQFFLPIIINNFIGPPLLYDSQSLSSKAYINSQISEANAVHKISGLLMPEKLNTLAVDVVIRQGYIQCSSLLLSFFRTNIKEKGGQPLTILNIFPSGIVTLRFFIPDREVFSIYHQGVLLKERDTITLNVEESSEFTVFFHPPGAGTFSTGIPIYVEEFNDAVPYTILKVRGIFYRSTLACTNSMVNFLPVGVSTEIDQIVYIVANHQPEDTKLKAELTGADVEELNQVFSVVFPNGDGIPYGIDNFRIAVKIKFKSETIISTMGYLKFHDGFDGECTITVTAVADKSLLTIYAFQFMTDILRQPGITTQSSRIKADSTASMTYSKVFEETEEFPLFPKNSSDSQFAKFMRRTKESMEDWLYEQGFQGTYRMTIGEEYFLSESFQSAVQSKNKNAHFEDVKGIVDLITKLTGREFSTQYPLPPSVPPTNDKRIEFALIVYKAVLTFLTRQGGHLVHVSPLFLLNFDDYVHYHDKLKPLQLESTSGFSEISQLNVVMTKNVYDRLTVQCWLDVFLQLYKVLIFYPTVCEPYHSLSTVEARFSSSSYDKSTSSSPKSRSRMKPRSQRHPSPTYVNANAKSEEDLLAWINDVFSHNRPNCVTPRKISNFHRDLADGIPLAVVTAHYCPYLYDEYWSHLYPNPRNVSEAQQNVAILALAWNCIRIGVTVTAEEVSNPHPVKFLIVCCLLYQILPSYLPLETITLASCLADSVTKTFQIFNPSTHTIGFAIRKFDSNNNFDVVEPKKHIIVKPESSVKIAISFYCKSMFKASGTLLLCGSHMPGGFASNLVFKLRGIPAKLQPRFVFNIHCPLYKVSKLKTNITSPFMSDGKFTLCLTEMEPKPGSVKMKPWASVQRRKVIRSIYLNEGSLSVPALMDMPVPLTIIVAAFLLKPKDYWIMFSNQKLGDFIAKVTIVPNVAAPHHIINLFYPSGNCLTPPEKGACNQPNCPRLIHASIPSKNYKLWAAVQTMISHTLNDFEKAFWNDYLETGLGLKLLSWIARQYYVSYTDLNFLFQSKVTYSIECSSPLVTCPPTITINDIHSLETIDLPLHVNQGSKSTLTVDLVFKSDNEKELRFYQLFFYHKPQTGKTSQSNEHKTQHVYSRNKTADNVTDLIFMGFPSGVVYYKDSVDDVVYAIDPSKFASLHHNMKRHVMVNLMNAHIRNGDRAGFPSAVDGTLPLRNVQSAPIGGYSSSRLYRKRAIPAFYASTKQINVPMKVELGIFPSADFRYSDDKSFIPANHLRVEPLSSPMLRLMNCSSASASSNVLIGDVAVLKHSPKAHNFVATTGLYSTQTPQSYFTYFYGSSVDQYYHLFRN